MHFGRRQQTQEIVAMNGGLSEAWQSTAGKTVRPFDIRLDAARW